ncbi:MFS general substrate transporter [Laetiporus sulphureus 93-53]|uniref:MFS general substrate transporter n=1 Tax=Laetiporus sulphureus 93-53 TaxID=1314785 RepID=A0A165C1K0_9APHY|nr:MFS general substrate transporter [Laetiporus sulphureus 93-53]KZT02036.1 MFS general substrate transporter [Laetiporus sulphureus 93-53]
MPSGEYTPIPGDDDEAGAEERGGIEPSLKLTTLDRTIDLIGMGRYQWRLMLLCGLGWMSYNMWMQTIAIILPRVQEQFSISDNYIGTLSSSAFAGIMIGSVGWGTYSDLKGRRMPFYATLLLASMIGFLSSVVRSFTSLCIAMFFLGSAFGGSMPTDGTLFHEHLPSGRHFLVTLLSVFFSFGSVVSACVALLVIPGHLCPPAPAECDPTAQHVGWKYLLRCIATLTLAMFVARLTYLKLHESPRYLVHAGRQKDAVEVLQSIAQFNGEAISLSVDDVQDGTAPPHRHLADTFSIGALSDRITLALAPEWRRTTVLVWIIWFGMSLSFTMFNTYLPKVLEGKSNSGTPNETPVDVTASLWSVLTWALGGCPGAILGAYLVESPFGRRQSLAGSIFVTAFCCILFMITESLWLVRASTAAISLTSAVMWSILYGWTPGIFSTRVRGSATGIASALSSMQVSHHLLHTPF